MFATHMNFPGNLGMVDGKTSSHNAMQYDVTALSFSARNRKYLLLPCEVEFGNPSQDNFLLFLILYFFVKLLNFRATYTI